MRSTEEYWRRERGNRCVTSQRRPCEGTEQSTEEYLAPRTADRGDIRRGHAHNRLGPRFRPRTFLACTSLVAEPKRWARSCELSLIPTSTGIQSACLRRPAEPGPSRKTSVFPIDRIRGMTPTYEAKAAALRKRA